MDRNTVDIYDDRGLSWAASHATAGRRLEAEAFADRVAPGALRMDMGCGAGRYLPHLGTPAIAFDASPVMLDACRGRSPKRTTSSPMSSISRSPVTRSEERGPG